MRGKLPGLPLPTMPTAHTSSAETAATPYSRLLLPGILGLPTIPHSGVQEGAGVGVKVAPAGETGATPRAAAKTWVHGPDQAPIRAVSARKSAPNRTDFDRTRRRPMASPPLYSEEGISPTAR